MDANATRFHLVQGKADWWRCRTTHGWPAFEEADSPERPSLESPHLDPAAHLQWNASMNEVTLWQRAFRFVNASNERLEIEQRRGAARDRFGNWYWIAPDEQSILVRSSGSQAVSALWPPDVTQPLDDLAAPGAFHARAPALSTQPLRLRGLAVTEDHYLVVGVVSPAGLLVFDLYSGGPPRQRLWPPETPLAPFDMDARAGGGVWMLDREHARVWELDRRLGIVAADPPAAPSRDAGDFTSVDDGARADLVARLPAGEGWPVPARTPIAIAALPSGGVLVLERNDQGPDQDKGFARVHWLEGGAARGEPASTSIMAERIEVAPGAPPFALVAHDLALVPAAADAPAGALGRLYIVAKDGNQAYAFDASTRGGQLVLTPVAQYFPMRLFGGRALMVADGEPWYDCGDRWVKLKEQKRPRYVETGELWTPVFDSGEPGCVWHRLMLDGSIPPGTGIDVYTRAADDWRELTLVEWLSAPERRALGAPEVKDAGDPAHEADLADWQPEPSPYPRGDGPERPYLPAETGDSRATWELLFQRARGRYLQVKLVLRGDGRSTPRLRALRAWYPRFSYLDHYLPAVYREDVQSASFLDRFLANPEGILTTIEDRVAAAQILFDVASVPPDALDWLGTWFGVALDPTWEDHRRRLFVRHALEFFAARGTIRGLELALRLALDDCVDERLFEQPYRPARRAAPVRIIERFRARRTPRALLGDVGTAVLGAGPLRIDPTARWQPSLQGADLHRRYRDALKLPAGTEFPLSNAGTPAGWSEFAQQTLGFVPRVGAAERAKWQAFLRPRHSSIGALNAAHSNAWSTFEDVRLPEDEPTAPGLAADWRAFLAGTHHRERRLWQDFLARRYRSAGPLGAAWKKSWSGLATVALPDRLPADGAPLTDWFQFEGTVLAMHRTAHRFTVMLPVPVHLRTDTPAQRRRLALARAVLDLEKPAHTVFDMRFYWAMLRLGEARLGDDTLIDYGSRAPELMAPMMLGQGYLAEAFLAARPGDDAPARLQVGRDRVGSSARIGGP